MKKLISVFLALWTVLSVLFPVSGVFSFAEEENVALGKKVIGPGSGLSAVTNGSTTGGFWDGGSVPSYVVIDLEDFYDLSQIRVFPYYEDGRSYTYKVESSTNGAEYRLVAEKTSDAPATAQGDSFPVEATARFIRVTVFSNTANPSAHLMEVMAFGTKNDTFTDDVVTPPENVALGKKVFGGGSGLDCVTDGNTSTDLYWDGGQAPSYVMIDLGAFYDLEKINVICYYGDRRVYRYSLWGSVNGLSFTQIGEKNDSAVSTYEGTDFAVSGTARYVKILMTYNSANASVHLVEVSVFGKENPDFVPPAVDTTDPNDPDNVAFYKPTRTNSPGGISAAVCDGNPETSWEGADLPRFVDVDLLDAYELTSARLYLPTGSLWAYTLYGSLDGVNFDRLYRSDVFESFTNDGKSIDLSGKVYRIIRVSVTGSGKGLGARAGVNELKVYGKKVEGKETSVRDVLAFSSYEQWLKDTHGVDVSSLKDENGKYDLSATYTEKDTVNELCGIVERLLGQEYVSWFTFRILPEADRSKEYFSIEDGENTVVISGSTGTCVASGLNWYLKYYCSVHISQQTKQVKMPAKLVKVGQPVRMETNMTLRYAYNYCTLSYTMAFFGYDDWRRELDWLYLNGVNLILDTTATEALWVHYLQQLGYTADEAKNYVCGYAYKAWWLMGNLEGYGGTVSDMWVLDTLEMARVNQRSMTVMGAMPALQAFVGAMPSTFSTVSGKALEEKGFSPLGSYLAPQGSWAGSLERPNVLRTDYDGYSYLAQLFYESQEYVYGQITDYFCGDVCHEGGRIPEGLVREEMSAKILSELMQYDRNGVWILQRWWDNPIREVLDGFGAYRTTNVLILDLASAQNPGNYKDTKKYGSAEFGGTAWIFSSLDNYGGNPGMHGSLAKALENAATAKKDAQYLRGMGITPEGTQNNPVYMDLYWEMVWRDEAPELSSWIKSYVSRRYGLQSGSLETAWSRLLSTVYLNGNADDGAPIRLSVLNKPKFGYGGGYYVPKYRNQTIFQAITQMMKQFDILKGNECYLYDLTDLMTTYLGNLATEYLQKMQSIANNPTEARLEEYNNATEKYLDIMLLMDEIASYNTDDLLGRWIGRAYDFTSDERTMEYDDYSLDMMTYNAKTLITAWHSSTLIDYACRRYNGVIRDYYYVSWSEYLEKMQTQVNRSVRSSSDEYSANSHFLNAWKFVLNDTSYRTVANNPDPSSTGRGLQAIYDYLEANYSTVHKNALQRLRFDETSEYRIEEGVISGVKPGSTVRDLTNALLLPEDAQVLVVLPDGTELAQTDALSVGALVQLMSGQTRLDGAVVGGRTPEDDRADELKAQLNEFLVWADGIDTEGFASDVMKALRTAKARTKRALSADDVKLSELEECARLAIEAKQAALNEYDRLHAPEPTPSQSQPSEPSQDTEKKPSALPWIFAGGAVALVAAVVAVVILVRKKKK